MFTSYSIARYSACPSVFLTVYRRCRFNVQPMRLNRAVIAVRSTARCGRIVQSLQAHRPHDSGRSCRGIDQHFVQK